MITDDMVRLLEIGACLGCVAIACVAIFVCWATRPLHIRDWADDMDDLP